MVEDQRHGSLGVDCYSAGRLRQLMDRSLKAQRLARLGIACIVTWLERHGRLYELVSSVSRGSDEEIFAERLSFLFIKEACIGSNLRYGSRDRGGISNSLAFAISMCLVMPTAVQRLHKERNRGSSGNE